MGAWAVWPIGREYLRRTRLTDPPTVSIPNGNWSGGGADCPAQGQPWANAAWKQMKSEMFRVGGTVDPSQLAAGSPAANWAWKQMKSEMFRIGTLVEPSQL